MTTLAAPHATSFLPGLQTGDGLADYWLAQATLRLRREICWQWRQRQGCQPGGETLGADVLPPPSDRVLDSLDLIRHAHARERFFETDVTAAYLTERIAAPPPPLDRAAPRGSFSWLVRALRLRPHDSFALALGLLDALDHAAGPVIAACQNDPAALLPTLGLAQRLWDEPGAYLGLFDAAHPLWRYGLLRYDDESGRAPVRGRWNDALAVHPLVARQLLQPDDGMADCLQPLVCTTAAVDDLDHGTLQQVGLAAPRLAAPAGPCVWPVIGSAGAPCAEAVAAVCDRAGRNAVRLSAEPDWLSNHSFLMTIATCCWLRDVDLLIVAGGPQGDPPAPQSAIRLPLSGAPLNLFVAVESERDLRHLPANTRMPAIVVSMPGLADRLRTWRAALPQVEECTAVECARRFSLHHGVIRRIGREAASGGAVPSRTELFAVCRAEGHIEIGDLAEAVQPRFTLDEVVLPHRQRTQLEEIRRAMRSLSEVHASWGTARAWKEGGLSVLFAGPSGVGKTMVAEALAHDLDLPMYRIDLSQVLDKFVGETPKRLKRLFDAAESTADVILFFDEADALFGRRTSVRDAHDRYANVEINYLLTRMESSRGLTVLATNRREDLDEAFTRRLRFIVEFPQPDAEQRRRLWRVAMPQWVDATGLDFDFLALKFPLTGGQIRAAVFHACLQAAAQAPAHARERRLQMPLMVQAVRRELDKQNRRVGLGQFGSYAPHVEALEREATSA